MKLFIKVIYLIVGAVAALLICALLTLATPFSEGECEVFYGVKIGEWTFFGTSKTDSDCEAAQQALNIIKNS